MDRDAQMGWWEGLAATVDIQELATLGPAGLRVGLLGNGLNSLKEHVDAQDLTRKTSRAVNYALNHTVAQPVCNSGKGRYLKDELRSYFRDVLFPMAHTVHTSPVAAYCSTWAVEYSVYDSFEVVYKDDPEHLALVEQKEVVELWKERCDLQLHQIGICQLRGVFDVEPIGNRDDHAHCEFKVPLNVQQQQCMDHKGKEHFYVTPNCLVHAPPCCACMRASLLYMHGPDSPAGYVRGDVLRSLYVRGR